MKSGNQFQKNSKDPSGNTTEGWFENQYPQWNESFVGGNLRGTSVLKHPLHYFVVMKGTLSCSATGAIVMFEGLEEKTCRPTIRFWKLRGGSIMSVKDTGVHKMATQVGKVCGCIVGSILTDIIQERSRLVTNYFHSNNDPGRAWRTKRLQDCCSYLHRTQLGGNWKELKKQVSSKVVLYCLCKEINIKKATVPSFELYLN